MSALRALVVGSVTRDRISSQTGDWQALGGAPLHAAEAYAAKATPLTVVSAASEDLAGLAGTRFPAGTQLCWQQSAGSTIFDNRYLSDGTRTQSIVGIADMLDFSPDFLRDVDFVHLSPLHHDDLDVRWYQAGLRIGLDVQGLLRPSRIGPVVPELRRDLVALLPNVAVLKASEREWALVLDGVGCRESDLIRAHPGMEVLISNGHRGGRAISGDGRSYAWRILHPAEVVDPAVSTGAGDLFLAAYLVHRMREGRPFAAAIDGAAALTTRILLRRARASAACRLQP
jgi:sugar/nucleoside kinase (ribokinase family)